MPSGQIKTLQLIPLKLPPSIVRRTSTLVTQETYHKSPSQ